MPVADATLTNPNVNGGTAVKLNAESVTFNWKNNIESNTVENKFDISEATHSGFEPPIIAIKGIIPIDNLPTNSITQELLTEFAICLVGDTTLVVTAGKTGGTKLGGAPTAGYDTDGTMTLQNSIKVIVRSFSIRFSARETIEGHAWSYDLNLQETT